MKMKRFIAVLLSFVILFCFFGCEKEFSSEDVKCAMGENPQEINTLRIELDDELQTVTAVIDEENRMNFFCSGEREFDNHSVYPEWIKLYKIDVTIQNTSGYTLKNIRPYMKRQWDMLVGDDFEVSIEQIEPHSKKVTATIYTVTDFDISVIRSAFVDNLFELKYDVYDKETKIGEYSTKFSYK